VACAPKIIKPDESDDHHPPLPPSAPLSYSFLDVVDQDKARYKGVIEYYVAFEAPNLSELSVEQKLACKWVQREPDYRGDRPIKLPWPEICTQPAMQVEIYVRPSIFCGKQKDDGRQTALRGKTNIIALEIFNNRGSCAIAPASEAKGDAAGEKSRPNEQKP